MRVRLTGQAGDIVLLAGLVQSARELAGLTQAELAERARLSREAISRLETGSKGSIETAVRLLLALGHDCALVLDEG